MSSNVSINANTEADGQKPTISTSFKEPTKEDLGASNQLSNGWKYWKKIQGSAEHTNRKMSSIDPLQAPNTITGESTREEASIRPEDATLPNGGENHINDNNTKQIPNEQQSPHKQEPQEWSKWFNPWSYIPHEAFNFPTSQLPTTSHQQPNDNQSEHSSTLTTPTPSDNGWFGWVWGRQKPSEENLTHDMISSIELKKNVKEAKKAIQSPDAIWGWYQNHYNDRKDGELSVLDTKTETNPVDLNKYPGQYQEPEGNEGCVVPDFMECFREITTKTKVRIATELYYNYPTEKHLYIKRKIHKPLIRYVLVVSVMGGSKGSKANVVNSKTLSSLAVQSIKDWYTDKETSYDYQIESVSLEASKLTENTSEDLFKLLINWREQFKKIDHVFFVGYSTSVPLSAKLLEIMISRNLFDNSKKHGLLSIDGIVPGPYIEETEALSVNYCSDFNQTLATLVEQYNVKLSVIGTLNNIPGSLAIHLKHPNIYRSLYISKTNYDNDFENHLFQILLISHNLGHSSTRLLIQLNKYFASSTNILEDLNAGFYLNAVNNSLSTTSLIQGKKMTLDLVNDTILDNEYNLIWTLHAFVDDFKKIKNIDSHKRIVKFIESYKQWDPQSKSLKELKYMLEVLKIDDYCGALLR